MKAQLLLKLSKAEKTRWEEVAGKGGLSALIRRLMNDHCGIGHDGVGSVAEARRQLESVQEVRSDPERSGTQEEAFEEAAFDEDFEEGVEGCQKQPNFVMSPVLESEAIPEGKIYAVQPGTRQNPIPRVLDLTPSVVQRPKDQQKKVNEITSVLGSKGTYRREDLCQRCARMGSAACEADKKKFAGKTMIR